VVVLLACLSLLLTLGGGAAAIYGADMIRLESGIALTGAGATAFCAGLLLAGVTAVLAELRRMRRLMEIDDNVAPPVAPPVARPSGPEPVHVPVAPPAAAAAVPAMPAPPVVEHETPAKPQPPEPVAERRPAPEPRAVTAGPVAAPERTAPKEMPPLPPPPPPHVKPVAPAGSGIPAEARAGLVGFPGLSRPKPQGEARERIEPLLAEAPAEPAAKAAEVEEQARQPVPAKAPGTPSDKIAPAPEAAPPAAPHAEPAVPPMAGGSEQPPLSRPPEPSAGGARTMLTSYTSGDVTYFMYSDGSIEADFPDGRRRFGSVEELRHYIEAGEGGMPVKAGAGAASA
jgi:hypothetical protein